VLDCAERARDVRRCVQLRTMPLPVIDAERVALKAFASRDRERGRGIESPGKQNDRVC
jgi:hypothetical protein